ncbi:hypothetical protein V5N11_016895 [Cardamine amara subsp. amara]|uniref:Uncharacterized protein n=1 Tax=Cardamine amara subsp. amara TaxID=228776 RepID=A0ABD1BD90_CARAN
MEPELSFRRELDLVPKPEEAGTLKISVKVLGSGILIGPTPDFVLSYKDFRLSNDHDLPRLNDWLCSAGLARQYVSFAASKLTELIFDSISLDSSQTSAMLVYMTCKKDHTSPSSSSD